MNPNYYLGTHGSVANPSHSNYGLTPLHQHTEPAQHYQNVCDHSDYYSSSPLNATSPWSNGKVVEEKNEPRNCGFIEFFGEEFAGMEETFRSALLQYFTQVRFFSQAK